MPGFNGTGPRGTGPMTGKGRGFCNPCGMFAGTKPYRFNRRAPEAIPFSETRVTATNMTRGEEIEFLKNQTAILKKQIGTISNNIKELNKK